MSLSSSGNDSKSRVPRTVAILQQSHVPKLLGIARLLEDCAVKARSVVRGTESQKQFNLLYTEFCRTAVMGARDVEEELNQDTSAQSFTGVSETSFLADLAAYVSHASQGKLTAAYLEHIAKASNAQAEAVSRSDELSRPTKRSRHDKTRATANTGGGSSPLQHGSPSLHARSPGSLRPLQLETSNGTGVPSHSAKLSSQPAYATLLMPWTTPLPYKHGIALDRVTVERPHHSSSGPSLATNATSTSTAGMPTILAICSAGPLEMLALWEEREQCITIQSGSGSLSKGSIDRTASSSSSIAPLLSNKTSSLSESPVVKPSVAEVDPNAAPLTFFPRADMGRNGLDTTVVNAAATTTNKKDSSNLSYVDCVSPSFLMQLAHFGVSGVQLVTKV